MEHTPDHVTLTLDGAVRVGNGGMRWMPPEKAAAHLDTARRRALAELRGTAKAEQAPVDPARRRPR
ncbi:MAG TPA: hypothetical protein VF174_10710 [Micromonosporaceae bacterium]